VKGFLIGLLYAVVGVGATFGWVTYGDSAGLVDRPFDMFVQTLWPMSVFIVIAGLHGFRSGKRRGAANG
jgi:hypothetical protein